MCGTNLDLKFRGMVDTVLCKRYKTEFRNSTLFGSQNELLAQISRKLRQDKVSSFSWHHLEKECPI
jgi:hypothetical protein